uniref:Uncharacterized protein n=1 Tax=Moniliophthora roreri TaxID=221103 RepID=A0A0W0G0S1_MONRR
MCVGKYMALWYSGLEHPAAAKVADSTTLRSTVGPMHYNG